MIQFCKYCGGLIRDNGHDAYCCRYCKMVDNGQKQEYFNLICQECKMPCNKSRNVENDVFNTIPATIPQVELVPIVMTEKLSPMNCKVCGKDTGTRRDGWCSKECFFAETGKCETDKIETDKSKIETSNETDKCVETDNETDETANETDKCLPETGKSCLICNQLFMPKRSDQRFCSPKCKNRFNNERRPK